MSRPIKVTPQLVERIFFLKSEDATNRQIAQELGVSMTTVRKLVNHRYANGFLPGVKTPCVPSNTATDTSAATHLNNAATARKTVRVKKLAPVISNTTEAVPQVPVNETEKEDAMLLQNQALTPESLVQ